MPTPYSGANAYATAADVALYADVRDVNDLLADGSTPGNYLTNPKLAELLAAASGEIEAACLVGKRYSPDDLSALEGNSAAMLRKLTVGLTMQMLRDRRMRAGEKPLELIERAQLMLKDLREGVRIFGIEEVADAGEIVARTQNATTRQLERGVSVIASRYFSPRGADLRP